MKFTRITMTPKQVVRTAGTVTAIVAIILAGMLISSPRVRAHDDDDDRHRNDSRISVAVLLGKSRAYSVPVAARTCSALASLN